MKRGSDMSLALWIILGVVVAVGLAIFVKEIPELRRYMKMESM